MVSAFFIYTESMAQFPVFQFDLLESTNVTAKEYGENGATSPTVIVAKSQSGGRGRNDHVFASPSGGLYMSIILRPELDMEIMPLITLAAGVACVTIIEKFYGVVTSLKWPNDIYLGQKKIAGILTETAPYSYKLRKIPYVVVGIGINVNSRPQDFSPPLRSIVTSLITESSKKIQPDALIEPIVTALEHNVSCLVEKKDRILSLWGQKDYLYGKKICWYRPDSSIIQGVGQGIYSDGCYVLKDLDNYIHYVLGGRLQLMD